MSQETLYAQELMELSRAWAHHEIGFDEYRSRRAALLDEFEEAMKNATRPQPRPREKQAKPATGQAPFWRRWVGLS